VDFNRDSGTPPHQEDLPFYSTGATEAVKRPAMELPIGQFS